MPSKLTKTINEMQLWLRLNQYTYNSSLSLIQPYKTEVKAAQTL
jgi:hypothetical protein